jgi:hypothetical protein
MSRISSDDQINNMLNRQNNIKNLHTNGHNMMINVKEKE